MDDGVGIKAIETVYMGYRFRSRLEARWAVFFNALSIPFQYEPEGFNLDGLFYLPDFYLPEQQCFFEVKGPFTDNEGPRKARALAIASGKPVFMFGDIPAASALYSADHLNGGWAYYPNGEDHGYYWCRSQCCGAFGVQYSGYSDRIKCCDRNRENRRVQTCDHDSLQLAYISARHCRFERGER